MIRKPIEEFYKNIGEEAWMIARAKSGGFIEAGRAVFEIAAKYALQSPSFEELSPWLSTEIEANAVRQLLRLRLAALTGEPVDPAMEAVEKVLGEELQWIGGEYHTDPTFIIGFEKIVDAVRAADAKKGGGR